MFEDNFVSGQRGQTQEQLQEEIDLQALENQERTIRELEVRYDDDNQVRGMKDLWFITVF